MTVGLAFKSLVIVLLACLLAVSAAGCGNRGPLYLPDESSAVKSPAGEEDNRESEDEQAEDPEDGRLFP